MLESVVTASACGKIVFVEHGAGRCINVKFDN